MSPWDCKDTLNQEDKEFVEEAAICGMAEVALGKIAQKSENAVAQALADSRQIRIAPPHRFPDRRRPRLFG